MAKATLSRTLCQQAERSEAEETRVWLELAFKCGYIGKSECDDLDKKYDNIIGQLVRMIERPDQWTIRPAKVRAATVGM